MPIRRRTWETRGSKLKIAALGARVWVDYFAEVLNEDNDVKVIPIVDHAHLGQLCRQVDMLYVNFGWLNPREVVSFLRCSLHGIPAVVHWVGTDVWKMANYSSLNIKGRLKWHIISTVYRLSKRCGHLAGAPWLAQELASAGMKAAFIPVVSPLLDDGVQVRPLPSSARILSYIPLGREEFYGESKVLEAARNNPDVSFTVVANSPERKPNLPNVEYRTVIPRSEMEEMLDQTTCYMRLTQHDGLSGGIEALLRGRYWIFTYNHPYAFKAKTTEEIQAAINSVKSKATPNYEGAKYAREHYAKSVVAAALKKFFTDFLDNGQA